jgi:hypothetical protein
VVAEEQAHETAVLFGEEDEEEFLARHAHSSSTWMRRWWRCAGAQCGQMLAQQPRQKMFFSFFFRFS